MKFTVRLRCQLHGGRVCVATETAYLTSEHAYEDPVLNTELMWCEGRESRADPVEEPDCSDSWTISMRRLEENDADGGE